MKIVREYTASDLRNETWQCDDFWNIVEDQNLEQKVDVYFEDCYDELTLCEFNDKIRFEGEDILRAIGADLHNTIFETDDEKHDRMNDSLIDWMENHSDLIDTCVESDEWDPVITEMMHTDSDLINFFGESEIIDMAKSYIA